jgi:hypothetical protein
LWKPSAMLLKLRRSKGLLYCFSANSLCEEKISHWLKLF